MSSLGVPALVMAVKYPEGMTGTGAEVDAIVGLYTAPGQYPDDHALLAAGDILCAVCDTTLGGPDTGHPFVPFVGDPVSSGVHLCVPDFASQEHTVWQTEDL